MNCGNVMQKKILSLERMNLMNTNEKIIEFKDIMNSVEREFIKEGQPIIITSGYDYFREVHTLFCRLHNLLESVFVLLEANMAEEAQILYRTMLNNQMVTFFLINNYNDSKKVEEYLLQPLIGRVNYLKNIKKFFEKEWFKKLNEANGNIDQSDIDSELRKLEKELKEHGITNIRNTSVAKYSKSDLITEGMYVTDYHELSKVEHADPSFTQIYREKVLEDIDASMAYIPNISKSNIALKNKIFQQSRNCYSYTFINIFKHITSEQKHLMQNYKEDKIEKLIIKLHQFN